MPERSSNFMGLLHERKYPEKVEGKNNTGN